MVHPANNRSLEGVTVVAVERSGRLCIGRCDDWSDGCLSLTGVAVRVGAEGDRVETSRPHPFSLYDRSCLREKLVVRLEDILYWDRLDRPTASMDNLESLPTRASRGW
jgi:hypothetical protein